MKIKLHVDWENKKILKEKEYEEIILKYAKEQENDDDEFEIFLDRYVDRTIRTCNGLTYLFNLNKEEREKILELWKEDCLKTVRINCDELEEIEIEI